MTVPYVQLPPQLNMVTVVSEADHNYPNIRRNEWDSSDSVPAGQVMLNHEVVLNPQLSIHKTHSHTSSYYNDQYGDQSYMPNMNQHQGYYDPRMQHETPGFFASVSQSLAAPLSMFQNRPKSSKRRACCCCFCCC